MPKYGFEDEAWERAKDEAREVLIDVARRESTITYSDLTARIHAITLDPHDFAMRTFLNEISTAEHERGQGLLSVVVVYKYGGVPGPGFFELARSLGFRVQDELAFMVEEANRVYQAWRL